MANPKNPTDDLVGKLLQELQGDRLIGGGMAEGAPLKAPDVKPDWAREPRTVKSYEIAGYLKNIMKIGQPRDIDPVLAPKRDEADRQMLDSEAYQSYRRQQMQEAAAYQRQEQEEEQRERSLKSAVRLTVQDLERAKEAAPQAFIKTIEEEQQRLEDQLFQGFLGEPRSAASQSLKLSIRQELLLRSISALLDTFETPRADRNAIMEAVSFLLRGIKPDLEQLSTGPSSGPPRRIDLDL